MVGLAGAPAASLGNAGSVAPAGSLWALGDTGTPASPWPLRGEQQAVAAALRRLDREAPADAVVLLGDNFYPDGLREREFKDRLRENLVSPYCRFLRLTPRGRGSLSRQCRADPSPREGVEMLAVLGNHDYGERESPLLQASRIPEYLANWRMPSGQAEGVELPGGLSVVLLQSMPIVRGEDTDGLLDQLRRARGPWRVVAAHHPVIDPGRGYDRSYADAVAEAMDRAGVPVHLFLAGHEHSLQVLEGEPPLPPLQVVSGAGSDVRELSATDAPRPFARAGLGFARVDAFEGTDARLEITVYAVSDPALGGILGGRARPVARFALRPDGGVTELAATR